MAYNFWQLHFFSLIYQRLINKFQWGPGTAVHVESCKGNSYFAKIWQDKNSSIINNLVLAAWLDYKFLFKD